jgi:exosortase A
VMIPQSQSALAAGQPARQAWLAAGLSLALAAVALCWLFSSEAGGALRVWMQSTAYNHCFLILPVAAYLAWTRRGALQRLSPQPDLRALALLLPLSMVWIVAALLSVLELQQLVVLAMFQAIAFAVLGRAVYRAMLTPLLYLFFLVPTGYFLVPSLQDLTAWFAVAGLKLFGIPVYSDGIMIEVPSGNFVVAEACAGLRFLIASVAFGVFFAALMYRSRVRWITFVALSVIVPIVANGIRAFGIIALSEATGSATAVEADHIVYGWVFFTFVTFLLILIGMKFADDHKVTARPSVPVSAASPARPWSGALVAVIGLALAASGPAYAQFRDWHGAAASLANAPAPPIAPAWSPVEQGAVAWRPVIQHPDREFFGAFSDGAHIVLRYVALHEAEGFHNNLVRGSVEIADGVRWHVVGMGQAHVQIDGADRLVATTEIANGNRRALVWHFYMVNGTVAASPMRAKLAQVSGLFEPSDDVSAFVAVAADEDGSEPAAQVLRRFVTAMTPLRSYLQSVQPR